MLSNVYPYVFSSFAVPKEILKDLDLGGVEDKDQEDSDYNGFIEEPRYIPPATMGSLLEPSQPPVKIASTLKPLLGKWIIFLCYRF